MKTFYVVIPAFNEAQTIRMVVNSILAYTQNVIVVDDGSTDETIANISDLSIILLKNSSNTGKSAALIRGMKEAQRLGAEYVITMDADGQHLAEDLPRFIQMAQNSERSIISGMRLSDPQLIPRQRYLANRFASFWISWAASYPIEDSQSGYRAYPIAILELLPAGDYKHRGFVFESEILIKAAQCGYSCKMLPINAIYDPSTRPSHFKAVRDIALITQTVAWHLIKRGMHLRGLYHGVVLPTFKKSRLSLMSAQSVFTLITSSGLIILSGGVFFIGLFIHSLIIAKRSCIATNTSSVLIVLGKRLLNGHISQDYLFRLQRALLLVQQNSQHYILILGGQTDHHRDSESKSGKQWLIEKGVAAENIIVEEGSQHTYDNFKQAGSTLNQLSRPVVLITNRYHLARSHYIASGFHIPHRLCGAEQQLSIDSKFAFKLLKETFYSHWYWTARLFSNLVKRKFLLNR